MDLRAVIEAGSESATSLIEKAAHAAEDASIRATGAVAVAKEQSEQAVVSAEQAAASLRRSARRPLILGAALLVAAAGGGYLIWRRRKAAAEAHLSGEMEWGAPATAAASPAAPFVPGVSDEKGADVVDEQFTREVDEVADEVATEIVDSIEVPEGKGE